LAPTIKILEHLHWEQFFTSVECSDSEAVMRDKQQMIEDIIQKDVSFKDAYFVGDTVGDGLSANNNDMTFIKASYGYGQAQDWSGVTVFQTINTLYELLQL
jgi:phosphoglycolate phosphatase